MTKEDFAKFITGRQYRAELTREEEKLAQENDLVIIFGASDDLTEFRGAITDESYSGHLIPIDPYSRTLPSSDCLSGRDCPEFQKMIERLPFIEPLWCEDDKYCWTFKTSIPHSEFDIMEDDEYYCQGIIIDLKDIRSD